MEKLYVDKAAAKKGAADLKQKAFTHGIRYGLWALCGLLVIGALISLKLGVSTVFFSSNPHFRLTDVNIHTHNGVILNPKAIRSTLMHSPSFEEANIFAIDLQETRQLLMKNPYVKSASVRRILPDTIELDVTGRLPVARFIDPVNGRLLDRDGIILPSTPLAEELVLPRIVGIKVTEYKDGEKVDDEMLQHALYFLNKVNELQHGKWLSARLIQLDYGENQLHILLKENKDIFLSENAKIIIPVDDMLVAMRNVLVILEKRSQAGQKTGSIDASYEAPIVKSEL